MREIRIARLAEEIGARVVGDGEKVVDSVATLEAAGPRAVSFFANKKYRSQFLATKAGAVIVGSDDAAGEVPEGATLLVADPAYLAFAKASAYFHPAPIWPPGIDPRAAVDPTAQVDPTATVMAFAWIGPGAKIGPRTVVHPHCAIYDRAVVGADCLLYARVTIREDCEIGDRTIVQPGAVIGADGFGFAFDPQNLRHFKVPQVGKVRIGPDVEIGANTCIDRGTLGDTVIGAGTKIDDLVMIGHNVETGPLCLFAGQTGIAGSTRIGAGVMTGGQAGMIGHLHIGDRAQIAAKAAVYQDVEPGQGVGGVPAVEQRRFLRSSAALQQLPDLIKEVRSLRKRLEALEEAND